MAMRTLVVSDLDNTLLNSSHQLDPLTITTFQQLEERGVTLAIASGRHFLDIQRVRAQLGVSASIISSNGACLHEPDDRLVFEHVLDAALVEQLTGIERPDSVRLNLYTPDKWLIDQGDARIEAFHHSTGFKYQIDPSIVGQARSDVCKVLYLGPAEQLAEIEALIRARMGKQVHFTYALPNSLEVMALNVNKGRALEQLLERLGMTAAQCVAFGDNLNDIEMLELAEGGCIMENANPLLFEALPGREVIGHHDQAGVAKKLRALFELD
ncbi:HAD family hydrolase [Carnimonas nigrificans]|uniref:HAD family hydrolase n=1 Tax=Carnimonas nigrificans TaxID=64323 RepID=UPI00068415FD|nr:HAD family hydrolase [Carnimonas nigrificans]